MMSAEIFGRIVRILPDELADHLNVLVGIFPKNLMLCEQFCRRHFAHDRYPNYPTGLPPHSAETIPRTHCSCVRPKPRCPNVPSSRCVTKSSQNRYAAAHSSAQRSETICDDDGSPTPIRSP